MVSYPVNTAVDARFYQLGQGDHLCLVYEDHAAQLKSVARFVAIGLERNERCLYIADDRQSEDVLTALYDSGVDVDRQIDRKALSGSVAPRVGRD